MGIFIKKISLAKDTPLVKACRKFKSMDMQVLPSGHAKITNQTRNFFQPDMQKLPTEYANFTNQTRKNCQLDMQKLPTGHASFTTNMNNTNLSNTNSNSNNTNFNNTDLLQQQEKTVVAEQKKKLFFIKESLSDFEIKKMLETANNDIELIREKYQIMEGQNINNIVGFLLSAIKRDFRPSQKKVKRNGFVNYEQRNDWDFEKIERLERKLLQREIEKTKNMIEFWEIIEDIDTDMRQKEIKAKVDYKNLLLLFPYAKEKIDILIKILAVLSLDNTYAFITYEDKLFSKNTALEVVKRLDYNSIINIITNHFGETVHDIFLKLDNYQNK